MRRNIYMHEGSQNLNLKYVQVNYVKIFEPMRELYVM